MGVEKEKKKIENLEEINNHLQNKDWFLQHFVELVNTESKGESIPLTLNVGGAIISGDLIGGKEYFNLMGEVITQLAKEENTETIDVVKKYFSDYGKIYEKELPLPSFIHFKNARFFEAGQLPIPKGGTLWRGKVNSVDGFFYGKLK